MPKYTCFILDDEPLALHVIEQHLSRFSQFEIVGKSTDALAALSLVQSLQPDLLFIDIEMPDISGLDLIASLSYTPQIIITTAYREYAVEGFNLNVLDYLVKPIPFNRFVKAIDKFLAPSHANPVITQDIQPDHILVKADRKTIRVALEDILYVEGVKDYVKIVLLQQNIITKVSIGNFLKQLPPDRFIQVHKSFVVSRNKIKAFSAHDIEIGGSEIPVGRVYKEAFLQAVEK